MDENTYKSPCVRNCCLNKEDVCLGCFRSLDEILMWAAATPVMRKRILAHSQDRKLRYVQQ